MNRKRFRDTPRLLLMLSAVAVIAPATLFVQRSTAMKAPSRKGQIRKQHVAEPFVIYAA